MAEGFTPVVPPVLVRDQALFGTGFFLERDQVYAVGVSDADGVVTSDDLYLVGTAEVPLCRNDTPMRSSTVAIFPCVTPGSPPALRR